MKGNRTLKFVMQAHFAIAINAVLLFHFSCSAQNPEKEYIIFDDGDTLFGDVIHEDVWKPEPFFRDSVNWSADRNWDAEPKYQKVDFRGSNDLFKYKRVVLVTEDGQITKFDIGDLGGYSLINRHGKWEIYTKRNVSGGSLGFKRPRFLRVLSSGKASLLEFKYAQNTGSPNFPVNLKTVTKYFLERNNKLIEVPRTGFRSKMKDYFLDNRIVYSLISRKDLGYNNIETILKLYNASEPLEVSIPGYTKGYVELEAGAKLYGQLRKIDPGASCLRVEFLDDYGRFQKLHRKDIRSYRRGHEEYVKKMPPSEVDSTKESRFMLILSKGKVNLYKQVHFAYDGTFTSTVYDRTDGSSNVEEMDLFLERDDSLFHVTRKRFKKTMANYFSDCPELVTRINNREFKFYQLRNLVNEYNSLCGP